VPFPQIHCSDACRRAKSALHLAPSLIQASLAVALVVVHQRDGVDDAVAAVEGGTEAGPIEQVHMQHREAL